MKEPSAAFLIELCSALREAEHQRVAESIGAGFLWALYPEWFDHNFPKRPKIETALVNEYRATFGKPL